MSNNFELLQLATLRLSQDGPIKDRLAEAYAAHLVEVETDQLPETVRAQFGALCAAMHRERPQARESEVRASVRKMSAHEASQYAALVVRVFVAMARAEASSPAAAPRVVRSTAPVVKLFASEG
ncbi:MAG TPA: hypothetical protein VMK82_07505 [Steroidobacteraceae bacterium]|nr:hypothetical protein [Steroidobacteraceae bacterium]